MTTERASYTKAQREYVRGIVSNLSLQRLIDRHSTGQTINDYHNQPKIRRKKGRNKEI
jgi:hypothetical protein